MPTSFGEAKEVGRPPGRTPGLVMTTVWSCWVIRRKDVTAKQQLLLTLRVLLEPRRTLTPTVLPVPCRVTQRRCTAVETSRESVPAAGSLFCSAKKVTKKGGPDDRALLTQGSRVSGTRSGARLNSLRFAPLRQTPHLFPLRAPLTRRAQRDFTATSKATATHKQQQRANNNIANNTNASNSNNAPR